MKIVEAYQTSDGTVFTDHDHALRHETRLELEKMVEEFHYRDMSAADITDALIQNNAKIREKLAEIGG